MSRQTHTTAKPVRSGPAVHGVLQRCSCGGVSTSTGECASCKRKRLLRRAATPAREISEAPPIVHDVLRSSGEPLKPDTQDFFQSRFGHDFSRVRIHDGSHAAAAAESVHATAFTVGRDIVFGAGRFAPDSPDGRRLIAHELSHVLQQGFGANSGSAPLPVIPSSHALEHQAEQTARQALSSGLHETPQPSAPGIARQVGVPDAGVPGAGSAPDAGTPPVDAGTATQAPPTQGGTTSPSPPPTPAPVPVQIPAVHCALGNANPCPSVPPTTVLQGNCVEPPPAPGEAPPKSELPPLLPTVPTTRFGDDAIVAKFVNELACCRAQRKLSDEIKLRFENDRKAAGKKADAELVKDKDTAAKEAIEKLKEEHPEYAAPELDPATAKKFKSDSAKAASGAMAAVVKAAPAKRKAEIAAVTAQDPNDVLQDLAKGYVEYWATDYQDSVIAEIRRSKSEWQAHMAKAISAAKEKREEELNPKPKPKRKAKSATKAKGAPAPADAPEVQPAEPLTTEQIEEKVEALLVRVRCEQQVWAANQLELFKHAWMAGRREGNEYFLMEKPAKGPAYGGDFKPPDVPEADRVLIPDEIRDDKKQAPPIAPELLSFLLRLHKLVPDMRAGNYEDHGLGDFKNKGFSVDLSLVGKSGSPLDDRGFYPHDAAVHLLLSIDAASKPADAEWFVIYNDSTVEKEVNDGLRTRRVGFVGNIFEGKEKKLNWHGPGVGSTGLKLHFHLDYVPKVGKDPDAESIRLLHKAVNWARDKKVFSILDSPDPPVKKKAKTK